MMLAMPPRTLLGKMTLLAPDWSALSVGELAWMVNGGWIHASQALRCIDTLCGRNTPAAALILANCESSSPIVLHEALAASGRMMFAEVVPDLMRHAQNASLSLVVRHEACEALGKLDSSPACEDVLRRVLSEDPPDLVRDSCILSLQRIAWKRTQAGAGGPLRPTLDARELTAAEAILVDRGRPLLERFMALYKLAEIGGGGAGDILCRALEERGLEALLRHDVAFEIGRLPPTRAAIETLCRVIKDESDAPVVRHESIFALALTWKDPACSDFLASYSTHPEPLVAESCQIVLGN